MALLKMRSVDDRLLLLEKLELQQDQVVDEMLEAAFGALPAFRRGLWSLVEIGLDCCELGATVTRSLFSVEAGHLDAKRCWDGAAGLWPCAEPVEPEAEAEATDDAAFFLLPLGQRRLRCRLQGLMDGLAELADDLGMDRLQVVQTCTMLGAVLIPGASAGRAALGSLTAWGSGGSFQVLLQLCNLDMPTQVVVGAGALIYCMGFVVLHSRYPDMGGKTMQRNAARTCLLALLGNISVLDIDFFGAPEFLKHVVELSAQPILALTLLPCVVCVPLAMANVGYISGKTVGQIKTCMSLGVLSSVGSIGACVARDFSHQGLMLLGSTGFTLAAVTLLGDLQNEAGVLSALNKRRSMVSADLLSFTLTCIPIVQGLGVFHIINTNLEIKLLQTITATMLVGTHYITLRSAHAVQKAVDANERSSS